MKFTLAVLWIVSSAGKHLGNIVAPKHPHNLAWGGDDGKSLYMTAQGTLYRMPLNIPGIRPEDEYHKIASPH
jgi:gluconolactonase